MLIIKLSTNIDILTIFCYNPTDLIKLKSIKSNSLTFCMSLEKNNTILVILHVGNFCNIYEHNKLTTFRSISNLLSIARGNEFLCLNKKCFKI